MSLWHYKLDDAEIGPVSFGEVAGLLRDGKITECALVRRDGSAKWEAAWRVVGLIEAARRGLQDPENHHSPLNLLVDSPPRLNTPAFRADSAESRGEAASARVRADLAAQCRVGVSLLVAIIVTGLLHRWLWWKTIAFPPPRRGGAVMHWFPLFGECNSVEYALLLVDVFAIIAAIAWWLCRPLITRIR